MLLLLFPRLAYRRAVHRAGLARPDALWTQTRAIRSGLPPPQRVGLPGLALMLRYMAWSRALYQALCESGLTPDAAGAMVRQVNWSIFGPGIGVAFSITRLRGIEPLPRVRLVTDLLFTLLFTRPFRRHPLADGGNVSFEVTACPLADYFKAQGMPQLTHHAACSLDFLMARDWGVSLSRERTIANGYPLCDFRFHKS
ncbi:MAG TPA: L-2-amino-thiazoline-4-carboxylic acid hydrolase [Solimonas sp.]